MTPLARSLVEGSFEMWKCADNGGALDLAIVPAPW